MIHTNNNNSVSNYYYVVIILYAIIYANLSIIIINVKCIVHESWGSEFIISDWSCRLHVICLYTIYHNYNYVLNTMVVIFNEAWKTNINTFNNKIIVYLHTRDQTDTSYN